MLTANVTLKYEKSLNISIKVIDLYLKLLIFIN